MTESCFPSGPWTGFYNYRPGDRHRMDLKLTFANNLLSGEGRDDVGAFLIKGRYDAESRECHWTKSYLGAHDVFYRGFGEGKGIWGTWEISVRCHGGFHIWPRTSGAGLEAAASEPAELVEALAHAVEDAGRSYGLSSRGVIIPEIRRAPRARFGRALSVPGGLPTCTVAPIA